VKWRPGWVHAAAGAALMLLPRTDCWRHIKSIESLCHQLACCLYFVVFPLTFIILFFFYYYFLYDLFHAAISLLWQLHSTSPISFLCPRLWHLYPLLSITELGILLFPLPNTMQKTKLVIIVVKAISKQLIFSSFPGQSLVGKLLSNKRPLQAHRNCYLRVFCFKKIINLIFFYKISRILLNKFKVV